MIGWIKKQWKTFRVTQARREWIDALRSGHFTQGRSRLRVGDKFCCLGVACFLYQKRFGDLDISVLDTGTYDYDGHSSVLPPKVCDWLDITQHGVLADRSSALTNLNDEGYTFEQIADVIETKPLYSAQK